MSRLVEDAGNAEEDGDEDRPRPEPEEVIEKPIRLHDLRLDKVLKVIQDEGARSVLDLGCGEGKLLQRLIKTYGIKRIVGVDASVRMLEIASRRLNLKTAGDAMRERVSLQLGSLTYADRRLTGFDAATLVEVIEHIDPARLSALEQSLFGFARPRMVVVTTPNREYNVLFESMAECGRRHPDHRFEWTRAEFADWANSVCARCDYSVDITPLGPLDETHGGPSQMAVFRIGGQT